MSIRLLVKFTVADQQEQTLVRILQGAKSVLLSVPGCEAVEVLSSTDGPSTVVLSEVWQSKEIHDAYAATTPAGSLDNLKPLLKAEPRIEMFDIQ